MNGIFSFLLFLLYTALLGWLCFFHYKNKGQSFILWIIMGSFAWLNTPLWMELAGILALFLILAAAFIQDRQDYYFSKIWFIPYFIALGLGLWLSTEVLSSRIFGLFFGVISLFLVWRKYMGIADSLMLLLCGFVLGFGRMLVCFLIALIIGIVWGMLLEKEKKLIPFVSCLTIGFATALMIGYRLLGIIM